MWRQSMHTNAMAPSREHAAAWPSVSRRNAVKASPDISPTPMANSRWRTRPSPQNMAIDGNVVGRIREDEVGVLALQQAIEGLTAPGITAQEPMPAEHPQ